MRNDAQRNRARILAAAEAVFGEQGAAGSTEEVARRAGVGIATVFRHFPTKDALIEAALLTHFEELTARAAELAGEPDPAGALRSLVDAMIRTGATKITLAALVGEFPQVLRGASEGLRAAVGAALRRAQDVGAARPTVTVDELYLLIRALAQVSARQPAAASTLDGAIDVVLRGVGLTPGGTFSDSEATSRPTTRL